MDEVTVSYDDVGRRYHVHDKKFYFYSVIVFFDYFCSFLERYKNENVPEKNKM